MNIKTLLICMFMLSLFNESLSAMRHQEWHSEVTEKQLRNAESILEHLNCELAEGLKGKIEKPVKTAFIKHLLWRIIAINERLLDRASWYGRGDQRDDGFFGFWLKSTVAQQL